MSERVGGRRLRRWQVILLSLVAALGLAGLVGWGGLGAWQAVTDDQDSVAAASATSIPVTSIHCSGGSPAYRACSDSSGDVMLSWSAVNGSAGITIQRASSPAGPFATIATLAGTATSFTDTTAAFNTQHYYEVFSGASGWASAADLDMALSLPPAAGVDATAGSPGTAFTAANLTAMSTPGSASYTTTTSWGAGNAAPLSGDQGNAVSCAGATECWAVTQDGAIWATGDGGYTWTEESSAHGRRLLGVDFINAGDGWAVGSKGEIYGTVDGGTTWTGLYRRGGATFYGVEFANASDGWVVGNRGAILASTDGGDSWATQTSGTTQQLNGITCATASQCWAVGNRGVILATGDGGATWTVQNSGVSGPGAVNLTAISCVSAGECWVVGQGGTILATTDGGTTWATQISGVNQNLTGISCASATRCVAVGDGGTLLATSDGGTSWTLEASKTTQALHGVSCASATQCVVVGSGVVLAGSGTSWSAPPAQYVEWTFSPIVSDGAAVTSAIVTMVDSATAAPDANTETVLLVSADSGSSWTPLQIANPTTAATVQTVNLASVIGSAPAVSGLELRYGIIDSNPFQSRFDLVHVDIN